MQEVVPRAHHREAGGARSFWPVAVFSWIRLVVLIPTNFDLRKLGLHLSNRQAEQFAPTHAGPDQHSGYQLIS